MAKLGLNEKHYFIYNPNPVVTDEELLEAAGLSDFEPKVKDPFHVQWIWGGTAADRDVLQLPSKTFADVTLTATHAATLLKDCGDLGIVLIEDKTDEREILEKSRDGLQKAYRFWSWRGNERLVGFRQKHGLSREEMEDARHELWAYHYNQAKADRVKEELDRVRAALKAPKAAPITSKE